MITAWLAKLFAYWNVMYSLTPSARRTRKQLIDENSNLSHSPEIAPSKTSSSPKKSLCNHLVVTQLLPLRGPSAVDRTLQNPIITITVQALFQNSPFW